MAFDQGIDFRATAGFVTDPSGCDKEIGTTANYPRTSAQGNTVGWEDAPGGTRDRTNSVDARLAGVAFAANGTAKRYRIDLPSSGWYRITLALGDNTTAQSQSVGVYDGTTIISNVVGHNLASAGGTFYDACGIRRSSAANWVTNEVSFVAFFSSTICRIKIADTATASGNSSIAHVRVTDDVAPSPSFNCGIDFRGTSAFVTDPTNCSPQINNFADYPHINAQGIVCGWEQAATAFADRSAAVDARLAGVNGVAAGTQSNFRIDLPATGAYRIEAAVGDATTAQPASGGNPAQLVEIFDTTTSLGTLVNNRQTASGHWRDATDTDRTSSANWVSNEAASTWSFTTTILRFKCGIAAGGSGSTTLSHIKVTQLAGITGTSSLSAAINRIRNFLATIAGTSTLTAAIIKKVIGATIAGTSSLTASINRFRAISPTVAGTSSLTAAVINKSIAATIAGTSSLAATLARIRSRDVTIAGTSSLLAALSNKIFAGTITGTSSLSATVSTGGTVKNFTATIHGTSTLRAVLRIQVPSNPTSGNLWLLGDIPTMIPYQPESSGVINLLGDVPSVASGLRTTGGTMTLRGDPANLPVVSAVTPGVLNLLSDAASLPASLTTTGGATRLKGDNITYISPESASSGVLKLAAGQPSSQPSKMPSGVLRLVAQQPKIFLLQAASGAIRLRGDGATIRNDLGFEVTSGVLLLLSRPPVVTPLTDPGGGPGGPAGIGVHIKGRV